ncbi:MAG: efflux RND transporter permease subunit [Bacteroidetes bacterium]|nr:efflux RND transporter permease subunit [Bacteroidota bacterium]
MANLSSVFIDRPVLATVLSITIVLFGIIGYLFLGVREYPSVDPPVISVSTTYPGANADVIESQITEPLEESINGIQGIRTLTSSSRDGASNITVEFEVGANMEAAANDVRDRVSRSIRSLPPDVNPPSVTKSDADANPIYTLTVQSTTKSLLELSDIGNNIFKERLQTIPGVSEVRIWGEKRYAIKLNLDPEKLAGYGLTPADVRTALNNENIELPSGRIEGYKSELSIRTFGRLSTEDEFNDLIIKEINGSLIRLRDVGTALLVPENERGILRGKGVIPMIGVAITPQPGANHISIVDEVYKRVERIKKDLPDDIRIGVALDSTVPIRKGITEVGETILIAFTLVILIIFIFLRHWRTTLIPVFAIPISLIGAFFIMYLAGFSINILTLLAIVLGTGLVVDDAIVVLENIYSKIEGGMDPVEAGHKGTSEIFFAIISTTITLAAVFLPIIFLQGLTGQLFREFGIVMAGSVIISAFVSLTLTPMMSTKWLRHHDHENKAFEWSEKKFISLANGYTRYLTGFMKRKWMAPALMLFSVGLIVGLWSFVPAELAPLEDKSRLQISATAPEGTSYELMDEYMKQLISKVDTLPETEAYFGITAPGFGSSGSVNSGFIRLTLVEPEKRTRTQQQIADDLGKSLRKDVFARTIVTQEQTISTGGGRGGGLAVQFVIQAQNMDELREVIPDFMAKVQRDTTFQISDLNLKFNKPEMVIEIDRDRARTMGVNVKDIAESIQLLFSGQRFGYFILNGKQYQVIGQASRQFRDDPADLKSVSVRNSKGQLIPMDNLVTVSYRSNPPQLFRFNRYVSATVSASPAEGVSLGAAIEKMETIADSTLDDRFSTSLSGVSRDFMESTNTLLFAFLLALILIYLVLSAQFESFKDPLIIMLTVPLAIAGAILSLFITDQSLNIFSQIGMIMLIGIVTKNGILIVEFANQKLALGYNRFEAAVEAAAQRFRPILMTSLATILGAVPIAFALGAGSQSRVAMGIVIIGGLMYALVLTLFIIPALFAFRKNGK